MIYNWELGCIFYVHMRTINVYITLCRLAEQGRERGESPADGDPLLPHVLRGWGHHDLQVITIMVVRYSKSCLPLCVTSLAHMLPVLYCTVLYCTVLYCTLLCVTSLAHMLPVLYCTVLYCTVL